VEVVEMVEMGGGRALGKGVSGEQAAGGRRHSAARKWESLRVGG
jgi:hypothetical protein